VAHAAPAIALESQAEPLVIRVESAPAKVEAQSRQQPVQVEFKLDAQPAQQSATQVSPAPSLQPVADLSAAGLQLVETVAPVLVAEETVESGSAPRRRRHRGSRGNGLGQAAAEALVLVETRSEAVNESVVPSSDEKPSEWGPPSNPRRRARPKSDVPAVAEPLVLVETKSVSLEQNASV
jgi:hypothetical protein